eukprot:7516929-Pyramimonas_sp.AAC.1
MSISLSGFVGPSCYAAEVLAGLQLKIPKCCIVPLEAEFSPGLKKSIEALLALHVPSWKSMPVAAMAEYLGVWIGPAANMEMWSRMFREWVE